MASTDSGRPAEAARSGPARRIRIREVIIGLVCAAAFAVFGVLGLQIRSAGLATVGIGPTFFPTLLAVGGAGLSLLYCALAILRPRPDEFEDDAGGVESRKSVLTSEGLRPGAVLAAPLAWAVALPLVGFVVSTWVLLTILILLFDGTRTRAWLIAPAVLTLALWLIFDVALSVNFPGPRLL